MHDKRSLLAGAVGVVMALALAGCAKLPVQDYAYAAPAGYNYSQTYGYIHGDYAPDGVYVRTGASPASPMGVQPYVMPTPAPSSPRRRVSWSPDRNKYPPESWAMAQRD